MEKRKSKLLLFALSTSCVALAICAISMTHENATNILANSNYDIVLNGLNGNVTNATLKTTVGATAKTVAGNDFTVSYKNMEIVTGKVGKIKTGGWYGNDSAICGMNKISVVSTAVAGDAKLLYGLTSNVIDGEVDLASATDVLVNGANFFKIVAKNDVEVSAISIQFSCEATNNGLSFMNGSLPIANPVNLVKVGDEYEIRRTGGGSVSSNAATKAVLPDFAGTGADFGYCTSIPAVSNYGLFESASSLEEVYIPERVTTFGSYLFNANSKVKEFTMPYALKTASSNSVPKGDLEVLNIHSVNATVSSKIISSSYHTKLKTVNVSYDVEKLPTIVTSWPTTGVRLNYEGTEAEWDALASISDSKWKDTLIDVYCSDTTLVPVTLHYTDSTFKDDASGTFVFNEKTGKSFENPGKPIYTGEGDKVFDGWYTAIDGGEKVSFPFIVDEAKDLYAHFIDNPGGDRKENARPVVPGQSYSFETSEDVKRYYFSITSDVDKVVDFSVSEISKTGGNYSSRRDSWLAWSVEDDTYTPVTISGTSASIENLVAKIGITSTNAIGPVRVRLTAGETFVLGLDFCDYSSYTYFASALLTVTEVTAANVDYTTATTFVENEVVEDSSTVGTFRTFKFACDTTGDYSFSCGKITSATNRWAGYNMYHFEDGSAVMDFTSFNASGGSFSTKNISLTAGVTYYVSTSANGAGSSFFKIVSGKTLGLDIDNPIALTIDHSPVTVTNIGGSYNYYSFTVTEAANYIVQYTYSSYPTIYKSDKTSTVTMTQVDSSDKTSKYAMFEAGTYYIKAYVSTTIDYSLSVISANPGSAKPFAIEKDFDLTNFTFDATTSGKWYKVTPNETKKYNITAPAEVEVKFVVGSTTTTIAAGETKGFTFTNSTLTYVVLTGPAGTYKIDVTTFVGPLTGLPFLNKQFNGTRNGTSYFKVKFVDDGYLWESSSTAVDVTVPTEEDGIYRFSGNGKSFVTNGDDVFVYESSGTYFLSSRNSKYSSGAYSATYYSTSSFTLTSGLTYNKMKIDGDLYTEFVYIDGEAFFDITTTITEGSSIGANCKFTFVSGGQTVEITVTSGVAVKAIIA